VLLFTDPYLSPLASSATVLLTTVVDGPRPFLTLAPALAVVESIVLEVVESSGPGCAGGWSSSTGAPPATPLTSLALTESTTFTRCRDPSQGVHA
jgi:hypothetical protein